MRDIVTIFFIISYIIIFIASVIAFTKGNMDLAIYLGIIVIILKLESNDTE